MYSDIYSDTTIDQSVDDYLILTLIGWSVMIVVTYVALAIRLAF